MKLASIDFNEEHFSNIDLNRTKEILLSRRGSMMAELLKGTDLSNLSLHQPENKGGLIYFYLTLSSKEERHGFRIDSDGKIIPFYEIRL